MECIFCDIINRKSPVESLYEDNKFMVFRDIKPSAPVHLLIITKEHIPSINHIEKKHRELIGDMFLLAKDMAKEHGINDGYKLAFNTGRKGGQLIDHLHLHLMGGWQ